jgi:sugar phosphate isomerase/epimerase
MMKTLQPVNCSINTATLGFQAPIESVIEEVARAGFGHVSPWRREVEGLDIKAIATQIKHAGLKVPAYCRSTYLPAPAKAEFLANIESNKCALNDAATLNADALALVVGSLPASSKDIAAARQQAADGIGLLLDHASQLGVKLALEPLHPVYAADRSCITTIAEALALCESLEGRTPRPNLGLCLDVYHIWWDPALRQGIAAAGLQNRIFNFHVNDWLEPVTDVLNNRGMMGDGVIDIPSIRSMIEGAGFEGPPEVEIFSTKDWWQRPMHETLSICAQRLRDQC